MMSPVYDFISDCNHDQHFFLVLKAVLFMQKLRDILDHSPECRGKYELVPLSGTETNKIADILVGMHNAANLEMHDNVDAN